MKTAKTFRLSEQTISRLQSLSDKTGTNETALIEIAIALFERELSRTGEDSPPARDEDGLPADPDGDNFAWEMGIAMPAAQAIQPQKHKKRKRH